MKLELQQKEELKEVEVTIAYDRMSNRLKHMIRGIRQYEFVLEGSLEGKNYFLPLEEIIYIEYIEGKTFLYTKDKVFESNKTLAALEEELQETTMTRIGKSVLMNVFYLKNVMPYPNHRLLAEMKNGERLIVSRKYIKSLQELVRREYHE